MTRFLIAALSGGLFGTGLFFSGMTNPAKVQGFLDLSPSWDPTLVFVMVGALIPMAVAWRLTSNRTPLVGGQFPAPATTEFDRKLVMGSVFFGLGWGLVGLCPGPSIASLSYQGFGGVLFFITMILGMQLSQPIAMQLDRRSVNA